MNERTFSTHDDGGNFAVSNNSALIGAIGVRRRGRALTPVLFAILGVLLGAGISLAVDLLRETPMNAAPSGTSTNTTGSQSAVWTTPLDPQAVNADPSLSVSALFSVSGANAANVQVGFYKLVGSTYTFVGKRTLGTITHVDGSVVISGTTLYVADMLGTAPRTATHFDVRVVGAVSSGNVRFYRWTYGASGAAAR